MFSVFDPTVSIKEIFYDNPKSAKGGQAGDQSMRAEYFD